VGDRIGRPQLPTKVVQEQARSGQLPREDLGTHADDGDTVPETLRLPQFDVYQHPEQ